MSDTAELYHDFCSSICLLELFTIHSNHSNFGFGLNYTFFATKIVGVVQRMH